MRGIWGKVAIIAMLAGMLGGCATRARLEPVFWPPAPDLPRVQFLRGIKDYSSVVEENSLNLLQVGEKKSDKLPIVKPYGIAVKNGKIYVTDTIPAEVLIIDLPAKTVSRLPGNRGNGKLKKPIGIAVHQDGTIYVADTSRLEVLQYDAQGNFVRALGKELDIRPVDLQTDGDFLYVLDNTKSRLLVLDRNSGALLRSIGQEGPDYARLALPLALGSDGQGGLFTANFNGRVVAFDRDGHFLKSFGQLGQGLAEFGRPRGIAADAEGMVYVVDTAAQNARIYDDKFRILMDFAGPGSRASLNVPAGIAVSAETLDFYQQFAQPGFKLEKVIFVVSQFGDNKISIYGMGKKSGIDYDGVYRGIAEEMAKKEKELKAKREQKAEHAGAAQPAQGAPAGK